MLSKCFTQYVSKFGKLCSGYRTGKSQFSFQSQRKAMPKNVQTTAHCIHLTTSKVMLKILQARFQQYMMYRVQLSDVQAGFRKGRETRDQFPTSVGSEKKQESSRKTSTYALLTPLKLLTVWVTTNCGKLLKRWEYQTALPAS